MNPLFYANWRRKLDNCFLSCVLEVYFSTYLPKAQFPIRTIFLERKSSLQEEKGNLIGQKCFQMGNFQLKTGLRALKCRLHVAIVTLVYARNWWQSMKQKFFTVMIVTKNFCSYISEDDSEIKSLKQDIHLWFAVVCPRHSRQLNTYSEMSITMHIARCDCHPGVCNKFVTVYKARYPLVIRCYLASTLSSVKHILQDVNR